MSRILVLGGYGGFGGRLSRALVRRGHLVLVAGRSLDKARAFCGDLPGAEAIRADRDGDVGALLREHRPDLLIDAAGPFQASDYRVPVACIGEGVPYLDLADARSFVGNIASLDTEARTAGVAVISGASSVPALSGAVARHLASGMERVERVDILISAASRAASGASVILAVLSQIGQPIRLWRNGRWKEARGWAAPRRQSFSVGGRPMLRGRWLALADVPDLDLLPEFLPGRPAIEFRAGTGTALHVWGVAALAALVRLFRMRPVTGLMPLMRRLQPMLSVGASRRSAMKVRVVGWSQGGPVEARWTLIAEADDGAEIPTIAAALLADAVTGGRIGPGARAAADLLDLAEFEPELARLRLSHEVTRTPLPPPLYQRVMGEAFDRLMPAVRDMHEFVADSGATGEAEVKRGRHLVARLAAGLVGFPPEGRHKLHVAFDCDGKKETWTRRFGRHAFHSRLSAPDGQLIERFGPLAFRFDLREEEGALEMRIRGWRLLGLPMPAWLGPRCVAREWQENARFHFDVPIALPLIGELIHYRGWLERCS